MRRIGYRMVDYIVEDLAGLSEHRISRRPKSSELAALREPLPEDPTSFDDSLEFLDRQVVPELTRVNHPRFHAYLPAAGSYLGALGNFLAAGLNPFVGSWLGGGSMSSLELVVLGWLAGAVGYPAHGSGLLTSGGSMANLVGLAAARGRLDGELSRATVYLSEQAHASCDKAALTLGVRKQNVPPCPLRLLVSARSGRPREGHRRGPRARPDPDGRMRQRWYHQHRSDRPADRDRLPVPRTRSLAPRGTAPTEASLPPVRNCNRLFAGLELADSLALDPHKWLYAPMGVGCVLFREPGAPERAFRASGDYLRDTQVGGEMNFFDRGPELSRPARALAVWLTLRCVGMRRMRDEILEDVRLARLARRLLGELPQVELYAPCPLSVTTFTLAGDDDSSRAQSLMEATLDEGEIMLSTTDFSGRTVLRFVVMNHRTTEAEVRRSIECIRRHLNHLDDAT